MLRTKDLQYRINHGDVKAVISYYPYISEFDEIEEMKDIKKFVDWARCRRLDSFR